MWQSPPNPAFLASERVIVAISTGAPLDAFNLYRKVTTHGGLQVCRLTPLTLPAALLYGHASLPMKAHTESILGSCFCHILPSLSSVEQGCHFYRQSRP